MPAGLMKAFGAHLTAFAEEHAAAVAPVAAAAPAKPAALNSAQLSDLRNSVFKNPSLDTAREWASGLDDLKGRCFEENDATSCQTLGDEMTQASNLFNYLSVSTKATAQEALRKATSAVRTAGFDINTVAALCLKGQFDIKLALTSKPKPETVRDFL